MAREPGYRKKAEQNVLEALQLAYMQKQEPVSITEIQDVGRKFHDIAETKYERSPHGESLLIHGGWTPFDWPDRTQRWLNVLIRKGLARKERRGRRIYFEPLVEMDPTRLGSLQIDMLTKAPYVSKADQEVYRYLERYHPDLRELVTKVQEEEEEKYLRNIQVRYLLEREGLLEEDNGKDI